MCIWSGAKTSKKTKNVEKCEKKNRLIYNRKDLEEKNHANVLNNKAFCFMALSLLADHDLAFELFHERPCTLHRAVCFWPLCESVYDER